MNINNEDFTDNEIELNDELANDSDDELSDTEIDDESESDSGVDVGEQEESEDEVSITIGDEKQDDDVTRSHAPKWVRDLRKEHRQTVRENKELKSQLHALTTPVQQSEQLGAKPKLEDYDYDTDTYEQALENFYAKKQRADELAAKASAERDAQQREWQAKMDKYTAAKKSLKVSDYDDAEFAVQNTLSVTQQNVILHGSDNPELLVYALGRNPAKAKELAAITDPVKFAFAISKLENQLKVTNKKVAPAPEKTLKSSGAGVSLSDDKLNALRDEARKSGDYSAYHAARNAKKSK